LRKKVSAMRLVLFIAITLATAPFQTVHAWDGVDKDGNIVEIDKGELVRRGRDIDVYHWQHGYRTYNVEDIRRYGRSVEIDVYDYETGEIETFEMDD
jgi:hypothetical protein